MRRHILLSLGALVLAGMTFGACGSEPVPLNITWNLDVQPIMKAHCVRCHSMDSNGAFKVDPDISKSWLNPPDGGLHHQPMPQSADFTTLATAKVYANGLLAGFLTYPMPPPPAPVLTDREYQILVQWKGN